MLKEIIEKNRYSFHKGFDNWEDAVKASCKPLIEEGAIEAEYADSIISSIKKFGPYIVIAPNICIPHAQEGKGVNETAVCFNMVGLIEEESIVGKLINSKSVEDLKAII